MTKNVIVVDEQGNEYGATYPKRAKGLVKNGRARFIDKNKICLACPPNEFLEDKMNENINTQTTEATENQSASLYTMDHCLTQIALIQAQTAHIKEAFAQLSTVHSEGLGDFAVQERLKVLGDIVKCRETTNQKLLEFYFKMYDDLKGSTFSVVTDSQKELSRVGSLIADYCCEDDACDALLRIAEMIKDIAEKAIKN